MKKYNEEAIKYKEHKKPSGILYIKIGNIY